MAHSVRPPRYKYAAVSLSPSCLQKLRVPADFAKRLQPGAGDEEREVILVGPLGRVWRVELRWEDGDCWMGGGWAELAAAHGIGAGWSVLLRREWRGVATLSAFDQGRCLARFSTPLAGVTCKIRPRFLKVLQPDDLEKMRIPDKFVKQHFAEVASCPSSQNAMLLSPLGKLWTVKLDHGPSAVLHGDNWARFLTAHDLSEGSILLFRYEGNMVLSVQVCLRNGCLKEYHTTLALSTTDGATAMGPSTPLPQNRQGATTRTPPPSRPRAAAGRNPSAAAAKTAPTAPPSSSPAATKGAARQSLGVAGGGGDFIVLDGTWRRRGLGPWISGVALPSGTTTTSRNRRRDGRRGSRPSCADRRDGRQGSLRRLGFLGCVAWDPAGTSDVRVALLTAGGVPSPSSTLGNLGFVMMAGGERHVVAAARKKRKNDKQVVYAIAATAKPQSKTATIQPQSRPASILPRNSFTKEINSYALTKYLAVKGTFCYSVGLLQACTIELKTSINSARSWPVAFNFVGTYGYVRGDGWKMFCRDNEVEEGDRCTFKVVEKTVWLVAIK